MARILHEAVANVHPAFKPIPSHYLDLAPRSSISRLVGQDEHNWNLLLYLAGLHVRDCQQYPLSASKIGRALARQPLQIAKHRQEISHLIAKRLGLLAYIRETRGADQMHPVCVSNIANLCTKVQEFLKPSSLRAGGNLSVL